MHNRILVTDFIEELQRLREKCKKAMESAESERERFFFKGRIETYSLLIIDLLDRL